jgi:hypothetical protein
MHAHPSIYSGLAVFVLFLHALFIVWVVFGALVTRSRPLLRLLHYLDKLVYPDVSATALTLAGVIVCGMNLAFYGRQAWLAIRHRG